MLQVHIGKEMFLFSFCLSRKTFACIYILYYKNVDFQDTGDIHSTAKFKHMTSLELNADCGLKYISAWSLHSSLHIYLPQQNDSTVPSLANALNHCEILYCATYFSEWQLHKSQFWTVQMFVAATTESGLTWKVCNSLPCSILGCFRSLTSACSKAKFKDSKNYPSFSGLFRSFSKSCQNTSCSHCLLQSLEEWYLLKQ